MKMKEDKIDKLAQMVARGFADTNTQIDSIDSRIATIESKMATKEDLANLGSRMTTKFDIMLDRHIGTFRKDYDELAKRVKKIKEFIFPPRDGSTPERSSWAGVSGKK